MSDCEATQCRRDTGIREIAAAERRFPNAFQLRFDIQTVSIAANLAGIQSILFFPEGL
jgi:hypothetical protein